MWRLLCVCLPALLLLLPSTAAARTNAPDDGTLSVRNGNGTISLAAKMSVIGSCSQCRVTIIDPKPEDGSGPIVSGYERRRDLPETDDPDELRARWSGEDMKFRLIGGFSRIIVRGSGIDLTAVGKGSGWIKANASALTVGTYALNGGDRRALPDELRPFQLVANQASPE